jgi:hypothetical protein
MNSWAVFSGFTSDVEEEEVEMVSSVRFGRLIIVF